MPTQKTFSWLTLMLLAATCFTTARVHAAACPPNPTTSGSTALTDTSGASGACTVNSGITLNITSGSNPNVTLSGGTTGSPTTLINSGTIEQTGNGSNRAVQSAGTGAVLVIQNNASGTISTANNDTVAAGTGSTSVTSVALTNAGSISSSAGGQAVNFNKILSGANSVTNTGSIFAAGSDAVRPGVNGIVTNSGTIKSTQISGSSSDGVDAQNNTGVQITNSTANGLIEGGRHGITGGAATSTTVFTTSVTNNVGATIQGDNGSGINLDGFNANETATIINHGTITGNGVTGDGDGVDVDGVITLTNTGTIRSINAFSSTTPAQSEGVTVGGGTITNSGTIEGDVASGNTNAVGRGITLAGVDTSGTAEAIYANSVVTNQNGGLIKGQSDSALAVDGPASGFTVTVNNNAGASMVGGGATNAAIRTGADNDTINNAGIINGSSSGKAIDMGAGNNTLNITGGAASILGSISGGTGGTNKMTMDLGSGNSFAYAGSISNFNSVELKSGSATLSGVNTYTGTTVVSGGALTLEGANRIAAASALNLNGGTLRVADAGGADGQTFASLSLNDSSTIDLDASTSLTFNALGTVASGKSLSVLNFAAAASPDYAFRLLGNDSTNASFLQLLAQTTIDGAAAGYTFDGTYTDVRPVPTPGAWALMISGLGMLGAIALRRKRLATIGLAAA